MSSTCKYRCQKHQRQSIKANSEPNAETINNNELKTTLKMTLPSTKTMGRLALTLCLYPILAIHAFASMNSSPIKIHASPLKHSHRCHGRHCSRTHHKHGSLSALHLQIPRGGGVVNGASGGVMSTLSKWTSAPNSAFNLALGVLAASTALLKISAATGKDSGDGADGSVSVCVVINPLKLSNN